MRMKHRWIAIAAVMAMLTLGACRPAVDGGAGSSTAPTTTTTTSAEPSASSTPYSMDDY
jgi:hypothetical protein